MFTVRSAYHVEKERLIQSQGQSSAASSVSKVWQKVWTLRVPAVVRSFLRRMCNNSLPTKENLYAKKIVPDPLCPLCGTVTEFTGHILWGCVSSVDVWMECNRVIQKLSIAEEDGLLLFEHLMDKLDDNDLAVVSCVAQRL